MAQTYEMDTSFQPYHLEYYGTAINISRKYILSAIIVMCIITPFTNWMIPIAMKTVKKGITLRYEK